MKKVNNNSVSMTDEQANKQEKVIQIKEVVDSIDTAKTVYYPDSLNSIAK